MEDLNRGEKNKKGGSKALKGIVIVVVLLLSHGALLFLGNTLATNGIIFKSSPEKAMADLSSVGDTDRYKYLFALRDLIYAKYDGEIDDQKLLEGAMKGMAAAVKDPYTVYMTADEYKSFMESSQGSFYGIGAQLGVRDDKVTIIAPIEGSPAEKAGLKAGDVILKVDGNEITEPNLDKTIATIRGEKGQEVTLTVLREGSEIGRAHV